MPAGPRCRADHQPFEEISPGARAAKLCPAARVERRMSNQFSIKAAEITLIVIGLLALSGCASAPDPRLAVAAPELTAGDSWVYEQRNGYNRELMQTLAVDVLDVRGGDIALRIAPSNSSAEFIQTINRELNPRRNAMVLGPPRDFEPAYAAYKFPLNVGQTWRNESKSVDPISRKLLTFKIWGRVVSAEKIRVPAGEFDTLKIVRQVYPDDDEWWRSGTRIEETEWYAPAAKRIVKREEKSAYTDTASGWPPLVRKGDWVVTTLTSFKLEK